MFEKLSTMEHWEIGSNTMVGILTVEITTTHLACFSLRDFKEVLV